MTFSWAAERFFSSWLVTATTHLRQYSLLNNKPYSYKLYVKCKTCFSIQEVAPSVHGCVLLKHIQNLAFSMSHWTTCAQEQRLVSERGLARIGVLLLKRVNVASFRWSRERGRAAGEPAARGSVHGAGKQRRGGDPRGPAGIRPVETLPRDWHGNDHYQGRTVRPSSRNQRLLMSEL